MGRRHSRQHHRPEIRRPLTPAIAAPLKFWLMPLWLKPLVVAPIFQPALERYARAEAIAELHGDTF